VSKEKEEN